MDKHEVLEVLSLVRDTGCCNMLDTKCIFQALELGEKYEILSYLSELSTRELYNLLTRDMSKYLKEKTLYVTLYVKDDDYRNMG
jgi:hypothetical protein